MLQQVTRKFLYAHVLVTTLTNINTTDIQRNGRNKNIKKVARINNITERNISRNLVKSDA